MEKLVITRMERQIEITKCPQFLPDPDEHSEQIQFLISSEHEAITHTEIPETAAAVADCDSLRCSAAEVCV